MKNQYTTKKETVQTIKQAIDGFANVVNHGFQEQTKMLRIEISDSENKLRKEFINYYDKIMVELKHIRAEQVANIGAHDRMQGQLDNHEVRLKKLELRVITFAEYK